MTLVRKRNSKIGKWSSNDLQAALKAIQEGKPMTQASALYGVPRTTIYRRMKRNKFSAPKMGRKSVFSTEQEEILTNHINTLKRTSPLNSQKVRKLAFDLAEKLQLDHNFNREKREAGHEWLSSFLKRNPRASILRRAAVTIQETQEVNIENPNSFGDLNEDMSANETQDALKKEETFLKMEAEFTEDSEILNSHDDPLENTSEFFGSDSYRSFKESKSIEQTENKVEGKFEMKLRVRENLSVVYDNTSTIRTYMHKQTKIVGRSTFLDQLGRSNQVVVIEKDDAPAFKKLAKRSSKTASWTAKDLNAALQALAKGKTMTAVSALHGVPRTSIYRRLKQKNFSSPKLGRNSVFSPKHEQCLTDYISKVSKYCPMNTMQLRRMAFELAEKLNLDHNFNKEIRLAGRDWLTGFLRRNPTADLKGKQKYYGTDYHQIDRKSYSYDFDDLVKSFPSLECESVDV